VLLSPGHDAERHEPSDPTRWRWRPSIAQPNVRMVP
jgi:hypothetical protein